MRARSGARAAVQRVALSMRNRCHPLTTRDSPVRHESAISTTTARSVEGGAHTTPVVSVAPRRGPIPQGRQSDAPFVAA